jgi:hypothetical protein
MFHVDLFADGQDFSWSTIQTGRNRFYQRQLAEQIHRHSTHTIDSLTAALNLHLNVGQKSMLNTSSLFLSLETMSVSSLMDRLMQPIGQVRLRLPGQLSSSIDLNRVVSLRVGLCRRSQVS